MSDAKSLTTTLEKPLLRQLRGVASTAHELLHSPASGKPCVHWRLRVFQNVADKMELVHEFMAPEPFSLAWQVDPLIPPRFVKISSEQTRIEAQPTFHRTGSPGALAVGRHFALEGHLRVEEVILRPGVPLEAEGVLFDPDALGPYRGGGAEPELAEATVRLPTGLSIRPALLPWALGAAAALLGLAGVTSAAAKLWKMSLMSDVQAEIGPHRVRPPRLP